ncbi:MAG: CehA/McbA family metallohydrolase [Vicinamibacteria bacterium]
MRAAGGRSVLKRRFAAFVFLGLLAAAAFVASRGPLPVAGEAPADGFVRVPGVVHVHTTFSDGGGPPEEVVRAARTAGLAFVGITDHNNLDAKPIEGVREGVLVLVGTEVSTTAGHVLALGVMRDPVYRFSGDVDDGFDDVRELGGFPYAAHPINPRADFLWTAWEQPGPWGIELVNGDSQWREAGFFTLARTAAAYALNGRWALARSLSSPDATLARWDRLLRERDVPAITGADAHSRVPLSKRVAPRFPSYELLFGLARNHVLLERPLTGRFEDDAPRVLEALRRGRNYVGVDALAPADGFSFTAAAPGAAPAVMGDTVAPVAGMRLRAGGRLPAGTRLRLMKDGSELASGDAALDVPAPGPGVYRVEARVPGWEVPFILSNPIVVAGAEQAAARRVKAEWPAPPPPPTPVQVLDDFEGASGFVAEFDSSSRMEKDVLAAGEGEGGSTAARLAFRLGAPGPGRPTVWCALVERKPRDLAGRKGLMFRVRADGVYRIWVQLRDRNPASADEGLEHWFASVKTSTEWRTVTVPFAKLRTLNAKSDGRLDPDGVESIVLVLDHAAVRPGTQGRIWVDDLSAY